MTRTITITARQHPNKPRSDVLPLTAKPVAIYLKV